MRTDTPAGPPVDTEGDEYTEDGGDLLVRILREFGVDTVFGIVSVHNLPLVAAVDKAMRFVPVRHEATAVNAADGYARARRGLGCALTSTGTGAGNAAGAMVEALTAGGSVLHVTGQIPTEHLGRGRGFIHETRDQLGMLRAVSKSAWTVPDTVTSTELLRAAAATALAAPTGPVSLEWPIDLQYAPQRLDQCQPVPPRAAPPAPAALRAAAELLAAARHPLVWVGGGGVGAAGQVVAIAERLGAGVLTSNAGRGAVPEDHRLCVGNFGATEAGQSLLDAADVLLSVGTHFRSNETRTYRLRLPATHIQVDIDKAALSRAYPAEVELCGEASTVLDGLLTSLPDTRPRDPDWAVRVDHARRAARRALRTGIGAQAVICDAVRAAAPRAAVIARDVTIPSSSWGNRLLEIYDSRSNVFPRGGGIGQGLGMGIGAAAGRPETATVVIVGDGGLSVHLGELATLGQERPWLTLVVFNDRGYGVLRNMQDRYGGVRAGVDLHTPDFGRLASAVGVPYALIEDVSVAHALLGTAVGSRGPFLVEIDVSAIGEMPEPFTPPVDVPDPAARQANT